MAFILFSYYDSVHDVPRNVKRNELKGRKPIKSASYTYTKTAYTFAPPPATLQTEN